MKSDAERILLVSELLGEISSLAEEGEIRFCRIGRASTGVLLLGVGEQRVLVVFAG